MRIRHPPQRSSAGSHRGADQHIGPALGSLIAVAIASWPFIAYAARNVRLGLAPQDILPLAAAASLSVLVLGSLLCWARRALSPSRVAYPRVVCTFAIAVALTFCYGLVLDLLGRIDLGDIVLGRHRFAMPAWAALLAAGTVSTWLLLKRRAGFLVLGAVALATLAAPVGQLLWFYAGRALAEGVPSSPGIAATENQAVAGGATRPDVFFFIFDAYSREDQLAKDLGFDNAPFLQALEERGFYVASQSLANYHQTVLSISSTLSMQYHYEAGSFDLISLERILQGRNETVRRFRELGYTFVHAVPGYWHGSRCTSVVDVCIAPTLNIKEYHRDILEMTPLVRFVRIFAAKFVNRMINAGDVTLASVRERIGKVSARPLFVYGHMLFPHPPYRFNPDCSFRDREIEGTDNGYLDNLRCTNRQILETLDWISKRWPKAIIVLQSDHGMDSEKYVRELDADMLPVDLSWEDLGNRSGILNAWRLPQRCQKHLYPTISAVNTFRLVFACIEGKQPSFIDDRYFLSSYETMKVKPFDGATNVQD